jgi:hypothetical protein
VPRRFETLNRIASSLHVSMTRGLGTRTRLRSFNVHGSQIGGLCSISRCQRYYGCRYDYLSAIGEIPVAKYTEPVFLGQGTADTTVYPPSMQTTVDQFTAAGTDVTFDVYPGDTHDTVLATALSFAAQRFANQ